MNGDIPNLTLFLTTIGIVISGFVLQFLVASLWFRRQDRSIEKLDTKLDSSIERLESKMDSSISDIRSDFKELDNKFDHLSSQMYSLNGKVNRLLGHTFGIGDMLEDDEEKKKLVVDDWVAAHPDQRLSPQ